MPGPISTGNHPALLWPGVTIVWGRSYAEHVKQYPSLFSMEGSTKAYDKDVEVTGFGLAPAKAQGKAATFDSETQQLESTYTNIAYALGYIVTHEEMQDNLYEAVSGPRATALAFSMNQTKENVAANHYNRAFSSSYNGADGVPMISASHPTVSGLQSNILPVGATLSEQSIEDMCIQIMNAENARGLNISIRPKSLLVATANYFEACRILKSLLQNDTANNATNALRDKGAIPEVHVNNYFTDADAWFIRTTAPRGMVGKQREAVSFSQDNDFGTKNALSLCYERYNFGWTDFRGIYGSQPA